LAVYHVRFKSGLLAFPDIIGLVVALSGGGAVSDFWPDMAPGAKPSPVL